MKNFIGALLAVLASSVANMVYAQEQSKPNILVIWGDDIGMFNISAYNHGMMGYQTPNIDRLAAEGGLFTDTYAQQTCTAGRAAFITGQHPFRTGLLTIGMPGSPHGIPEWTPTIADLLKNHDYATGQFGKNHLGDQDKHLPTEFGFDEFFGNLYHLNAEEEPETYYYPKEPEFREKYGPRGVIKATADGQVEDTGPMTRKRMETADEEFLAAGLDFMERSVDQDRPFFMWFNSTRMHVWTRLKPEAQGRTGIGLYPDGMAEHDDHVGILLDKLDELGIAENTIVVYSTDNGVEKFSWPDGGIAPWYGEKGTTWEGGMRVPQLIRWPGVVKPGSKINGIVSHEDWLPTFLAAAGESDVVEKLKEGHVANGEEFRVHMDGYNLMPYLSGEAEDSPRERIFYFSAAGELNAVRWRDWKATFAHYIGHSLIENVRMETVWPIITNLRADPFEQMWKDSKMYSRWFGDQMWFLVPAQEEVADFLSTIEGYPFQVGSTLNASGIDYQSLRAMKVLEEITEKGIVSPSR